MATRARTVKAKTRATTPSPAPLACPMVIKKTPCTGVIIPHPERAGTWLCTRCQVLFPEQHVRVMQAARRASTPARPSAHRQLTLEDALGAPRARRSTRPSAQRHRFRR